LRGKALVFACLLWGALAAARAEEVVVFAAASLTDALLEIAASYEEATGTEVVLSFGASNLLARQIRAGAPADVFLSADEARMDELDRRGLVLEGARVSALSNTLAVVVPRGSRLRIVSAADLAGPGVRTLVLAEPTAVPAGIYARAWLRSRGVWPKVIDRVVPTESVRGALAAVAAGNADAGIVYRTDASLSDRVEVAFEVPAAEGPPISYPFAVLRGARDPAAARRFLDYLLSPPATTVFRRLGFLLHD
jgi:molybdate transport system substrate-binding protein